MVVAFKRLTRITTFKCISNYPCRNFYFNSHPIHFFPNFSDSPIPRLPNLISPGTKGYQNTHYILQNGAITPDALEQHSVRCASLGMRAFMHAGQISYLEKILEKILKETCIPSSSIVKEVNGLRGHEHRGRPGDLVSLNLQARQLYPSRCEGELGVPHRARF